MFPNDIKPRQRPRPASIDGFIAARPINLPPARPQARSSPNAQLGQEPLGQTPQPSFFRKLMGRIGMGIVFVLLIAAAPLIQLPGIGQILVAIYGITAIFLKIESRTTFIMALIALAVVFISSVRSDVMLAGTFGLYAFLLLAIATISLIRELRSEI